MNNRHEEFRLIRGSAHDIPLPDGSVQMVATSPPYWGLRKYAGEQGVDWPAVTYRLNEWCPPVTVDAMRCELGLEPSPVAYIGHLILCLREWRRVLRDDGVAFVNLGDSYASGKMSQSENDGIRSGQTLNGRYGHTDNSVNSQRRSPIPDGLKPKDKCGIPELFVLAARADGWWWRSTIVWAKPNPMPESVTDRPTSAWEHVFLLTKSARYFWDAEAVKESGVVPEGTRRTIGKAKDDGLTRAEAAGRKPSGNEAVGFIIVDGTRNLRNVWQIATQPTPFAHFATWPEKLVEPMIRAGTSARGCCPECGAPWERVVERTNMVVKAGPSRDERSQNGQLRTQVNGTMVEPPTSTTTGWQPTCECFGHIEKRIIGAEDDPSSPGDRIITTTQVYVWDRPEPHTVPCTVLDPFSGSATTGIVAIRERRHYVGVDVSDEYLGKITQQRIKKEADKDVMMRKYLDDETKMDGQLSFFDRV